MSLRGGTMSLRAQRGNLLRCCSIIQVSYRADGDCHVVPPRNDSDLDLTNRIVLDSNAIFSQTTITF
jgi:hypothetical protein